MYRYNIYFLLFIIIIFTSSCASSRKATRQREVAKLVHTARSYIGTPYKWGGLNRSGMDCSGLLYNSFSSIGYQLPRTSAQQIELGKKVKFKKLQPGDLVFFATGKKKRKVTHVGMVTQIKGENDIYFIHASTSKGVVESNLYNTYYLKRFRKARRIF